jgi:hypothetical protein
MIHLFEQMTKNRAKFYFLFENLKTVGLCPALNWNVISVNARLSTTENLKGLDNLHQFNGHKNEDQT